MSDDVERVINRFEALGRLLYPTEMTPTAKRQFDQVIADERARLHQPTTSIRQATLDEAALAVHVIRFDADGRGSHERISGPDSFYNGCLHAERAIKDLPR